MTQQQPTATIQHLRTTNDKNGNPRRLWHVSITHGQEGRHGIRYTRTVAVYDEGYTGSAFRHALARALQDTGVQLLELRSMDVTPKEYRDTLDAHQEATGNAEKVAFAVADGIVTAFDRQATAGGA